MKTQKPSRKTKEKHIRRAVANAALEGLRPSKAALADMREYVAGVITIDQGIQRVKDRHAICR
jgi:hypothetical protein